MSGEKIRMLRLLARLSQQRLAKKAGISDSLISGYERGIRRPGPKNRARLARALAVEIKEIFVEGKE